jgi:hypothetical protein
MNEMNEYTPVCMLVCGADVGLRGALSALLFSYELAWLQLGLECVFGALIPGFSDRKAIEQFVNTQFFANAEIEAKYPGYELHPNGTHSGVPCFKKPLAAWTVKKFFAVSPFELGNLSLLTAQTHNLCVATNPYQLVYVLDRLKVERVIPSDPCLFRPSTPSTLKSSAAVITAFGAQFLSGVGNVVRHCALFGYQLQYSQPIVAEIDFTVKVQPAHSHLCFFPVCVLTR